MTTRRPVHRTFASIKHGDERHHHYHAALVADPQFGPVLRMAFTPPLAPGEEPVMPMTAANLRVFAEGAVRMAEAIEAAEAARDANG